MIIASFRSQEDKDKIMENKSKLSKSKKPYLRAVSIFQDKPYEQRMMQANMKVIADTVGKDKIHMRGSRLFPGKKPANNK